MDTVPAHNKQLQLDYHVISDAAGKATNEDAAGIYCPTDLYMQTYKGAAFVVADGVSSAEAGRDASKTAVDAFLQDYFKTPDTWSVRQSTEQVLSTMNLRLYRHSHAFNNDSKGHLCTFSAVIIKSHSAYVFHVGDSRVYHWRDQQLDQLTTDHTVHISKSRSFLARALGMDGNLQLDYQRVHLAAGDKLLLSTDGLHEFVSPTELNHILTTAVSSEA